MATAEKSDASAQIQSPPDQASLVRDLMVLVAEPLGQVEEILHRELHSDAPFAGDLLDYVASLGGKRMRPCLLLLSGMATGKLQVAHATLAAVIEMIHTATLVHDDVLDHAATRRHKATVNSRWGNQAAVLLGDYLFTHAFCLASTVDSQACQMIGRSTNTVCAGEMKQVGQRGNLNLTEEEYFDIIRGKTAELCACCCQIGAHYAGATPSVVEHIRQFGMGLGMAFQIVDDLLDLQGTEGDMGKSNGNDLTHLKLTLPVIHALHQLDPRARQSVCEMLEQEASAESTRQEITRLVEVHGSVDYAREVAGSLVETAVRQLDVLDDSAARRALTAMAQFVLTRRA